MRLLERGFAGDLTEGEQLHRHCSLKVGGPAALFAVAKNIEDLEILLRSLEEMDVPWFLLGGGTNVLFANGGYAGCVAALGAMFSEIRREENTVLFTGASAALPEVVARTGDLGLTGLECLAGIPGSVGGAVRMNAGNRNGEISQMLEEVHVFKGKRARWVKKVALGFDYRSSGIQEGEIILAARFRLARSSPSAVHSKIREQIQKKRESQPLDVPSAGCWFRNPEGDSAGRLIDEAGMKGISCGGAVVSRIHANFLVNAGGATSEDFLALAKKVKESVLERIGIRLEEEVRVIHG
jgi:UDP-N-acetylmuramate dehydrogenase